MSMAVVNRVDTCLRDEYGSSKLSRHLTLGDRFVGLAFPELMTMRCEACGVSGHLIQGDGFVGPAFTETRTMRCEACVCMPWSVARLFDHTWKFYALRMSPWTKVKPITCVLVAHQ